jgi:hypothetical protein
VKITIRDIHKQTADSPAPTHEYDRGMKKIYTAEMHGHLLKAREDMAAGRTVWVPKRKPFVISGQVVGQEIGTRWLYNSPMLILRAFLTILRLTAAQEHVSFPIPIRRSSSTMFLKLR